MAEKNKNLNSRFNEFISFLDPVKPTRILELAKDMHLKCAEISELRMTGCMKGLSLLDVRDDNHRAISVEKRSRVAVDAIAERFLK